MPDTHCEQSDLFGTPKAAAIAPKAVAEKPKQAKPSYRMDRLIACLKRAFKDGRPLMDCLPPDAPAEQVERALTEYRHQVEFKHADAACFRTLSGALLHAAAVAHPDWDVVDMAEAASDYEEALLEIDPEERYEYFADGGPSSDEDVIEWFRTAHPLETREIEWLYGKA